MPPNTGTSTISITINPAVLVVNPVSLPAGTVGVAYNSPIVVTGGTNPYTCTITAGTLPTGLSLGANCLVSGTPTTATTAILTIKATDSANPQASGVGPVTLVINPAAVTLTAGNPPAGTIGLPYVGIVPATGGLAPYTCTIKSGTLPTGTILGPNCTVTGIPTVAGNFPVTLNITDSTLPTANTGTRFGHRHHQPGSLGRQPGQPARRHGRCGLQLAYRRHRRHQPLHLHDHRRNPAKRSEPGRKLPGLRHPQLRPPPPS